MAEGVWQTHKSSSYSSETNFGCDEQSQTTTISFRSQTVKRCDQHVPTDELMDGHISCWPSGLHAVLFEYIYMYGDGKYCNDPNADCTLPQGDEIRDLKTAIVSPNWSLLKPWASSAIKSTVQFVRRLGGLLSALRWGQSDAFSVSDWGNVIIALYRIAISKGCMVRWVRQGSPFSPCRHKCPDVALGNFWKRGHQWVNDWGIASVKLLGHTHHSPRSLHLFEYHTDY